ncbi:MAG: hypothetical protein EP330_12600 [Deltaproteobacteria bacterium]|nr:MAG: hypothetical protein EP330_12600 [Deltaproteobacteria bacterium]
MTGHRPGTWTEEEAQARDGLDFLDDGTMDAPRPERSETGHPEPLQRVWWWAPVIGAVLGLMLAAVTPHTGGPRQAPQAWVVLQAQDAAMATPDAEQRAKALALGEAYLAHGPRGPYRDLIAQGHERLLVQGN